MTEFSAPILAIVWFLIVLRTGDLMGIDWDVIRVTIGSAAIGTAIGLIALSILRYLHDDISNEGKRAVRRSLIALLIHPVPALVAIRSGSLLYSVGGR